MQESIAYKRAVSVLPTAEEVAAAEQTETAQRAQTEQLLAVAEGYPDLEADEQFLALQQALTDAEDRVALARAFFNDALTVWNDRSQALPFSLVARFMRSPGHRLFDDAADERAPIEITASK